jgi:hypothetical protein
MTIRLSDAKCKTRQGTVFGLGAALVVTWALASFVEALAETTRTSMSDPLPLVGGPALLAGLALIACYLRRAARHGSIPSRHSGPSSRDRPNSNQRMRRVGAARKRCASSTTSTLPRVIVDSANRDSQGIGAAAPRCGPNV